MKKLLLSLLLSVFIANIFAINFNLGSDVVNRYIIRGNQYGNSVCIQPNISLSIGNLTILDWANYSLGSDDNIFDENDRTISYTINTSIGSFTPLVNDYFYPNIGLPFSNFDTGHIIETGFIYNGQDYIPLSFTMANCIHNDPDHSMFAELSYTTIVNNNIALNTFIGVSSNNSVFNGNNSNNIQITELGLTGSKSIEITDKFSLPVSISFILNPHKEKVYLVFKTTL